MKNFERRFKPIPQIYPCLVVASEKIYLKAKPVAEENLKIYERVYRLKRDQLESNIRYAINRIKSDKCSYQSEWKTALKALKNAWMTMGQNQTPLSVAEMNEIDCDLRKRMCTLEKAAREESLVELDEDSAYFKYCALKKEVKECLQTIQSLKYEIDRKRIKKEELVEDRTEKEKESTKGNFEEDQNHCTPQLSEYHEAFTKIARYEIDEKELELANLTFQLYMANNRFVKVFGMKELFFPEIYERSLEQDSLNYLFSQFLAVREHCPFFSCAPFFGQ